ncbi:MAG: hypothetical protein ABR526_01080 [Chthoniobacterales bacterium]
MGETQDGAEGGEVGADLLRAFDAESGADGGVVIGARFDLLHERAEADFDAGRYDWDGRGKRWQHWRAGGRSVPAVACEVFPRGPLSGGVLDNRLALQDVVEVIGVGRLHKPVKYS